MLHGNLRLARRAARLAAALCLLTAVRVATVSAAEAAAAANPILGLAHECPPSFELLEGNACRLRSLYDMYDTSPSSGGLRVKLPPPRDGFSPQEIDLGKYLFFDPLLSGNHRLACAGCHNPDLGFADGRPRSVVAREGPQASRHVREVVLPRGAPTLWNVGFLNNLFWDGRAHTLEEQAQGPLYSKDEMATTKEQLERDLNAEPNYRRLFAQAFHLKGSEPITAEMVTRALAGFESTLVSLNSAYDRYAHGDDDALSEQEKRGFAIFRGVILGCSQCHTPPLFTNDAIEVTGVPNAPGVRFDEGAETVTHEPELRGAFKTPTLRNIALTAPYMHSGQFATLSEAVAFYNDRAGHSAPPDENLKIDWRMILRRPVLNQNEIADLVAFLGSLTDESLLPAVPARVPSGLRTR
jgi:cytochrome c peroxidase